MCKSNVMIEGWDSSHLRLDDVHRAQGPLTPLSINGKKVVSRMFTKFKRSLWRPSQMKPVLSEPHQEHPIQM